VNPIAASGHGRVVGPGASQELPLWLETVFGKTSWYLFVQAHLWGMTSSLATSAAVTQTTAPCIRTAEARQVSDRTEASLLQPERRNLSKSSGNEANASVENGDAASSCAPDLVVGQRRESSLMTLSFGNPL
jgi:hypothetical protein